MLVHSVVTLPSVQQPINHYSMREGGRDSVYVEHYNINVMSNWGGIGTHG